MMIPLLVLVSGVIFIVIQLPPGDYVSRHVARLEMEGVVTHEAEIEALKRRYGLDRPVHEQYLLWVRAMLRGDFGYSFAVRRPVLSVVAERLPYSIIISVATLLFSWVVAFLVGTYTATRQYSPGDYIASFLGFLGLATPNFMLALILMWIMYSVFGFTVGGLFSPEYQDAPWTMGRVLDLLKHLIIPVIVVGTAGTAGSIRILRANLLDELNKPYVITAEAKGVPPFRRLCKYPLRVALIPFTSTVGWELPNIVSGETITAVVLSLPTVGPMLLRALVDQDMFLAGSLILFLSLLTLVGTLVSDLLLAWLDPRIRYDR